MAEDKKAPEVNKDINAGVPGPDDAKPEAEAEKSTIIDLTQQDDSLPQFPTLPAGIYKCDVEDTQFGLSQKGNPRIAFTFRITEPENAEVDGRLVYYHTVTNGEAGLARLKRLLVRIAPAVDLKAFDPQSFCESGVILGFPCMCKVNQRFFRDPETKKTSRRNNVTDVMAPDKSQDFMGEVK